MFDLRPGPWDGLIHSFDGVPPDCLEGLVTLGRKVIPGRRVIKCLRLLQVVPLGDGDTLGSRPLQCNVGGRGHAWYAQRRTTNIRGDMPVAQPFDGRLQRSSQLPAVLLGH